MQVSADFPTALQLMYQTKKFNRIYQNKQYSNTSNEARSYKLKLGGKPRDIQLRLLNGDINMFYEVLWSKIYDLPMDKTKGLKTIVDLGANVGFASIFFAEKYKDARIIAVEPSLGNFTLLKHNTATYDNIHAVQAAIYPSSGSIPFLEDTLAYNSHVDPAGKGSYTVRAATVTEIMEEHNIEEIDLLKLDIEGAEQMLLAQNTDWLKKVKLIVTELHKPYSLEDFKKDLRPYNFKVLSPEESGLPMIIAERQ